MDTVREVSQPGAYGYEYRVALVESRRRRPYLQVSGFSWHGNSGGRVTIRRPLTEEGRTELLRLLDYVAADDREAPWCTMASDVPECLGERYFAGPQREVQSFDK
jgi:hypothetical protein